MAVTSTAVIIPIPTMIRSWYRIPVTIIIPLASSPTRLRNFLLFKLFLPQNLAQPFWAGLLWIAPSDPRWSPLSREWRAPQTAASFSPGGRKAEPIPAFVVGSRWEPFVSVETEGSVGKCGEVTTTKLLFSNQTKDVPSPLDTPLKRAMGIDGPVPQVHSDAIDGLFHLEDVVTDDTANHDFLPWPDRHGSVGHADRAPARGCRGFHSIGITSFRTRVIGLCFLLGHFFGLFLVAPFKLSSSIRDVIASRIRPSAADRTPPVALRWSARPALNIATHAGHGFNPPP